MTTNYTDERRFHFPIGIFREYQLSENTTNLNLAKNEILLQEYLHHDMITIVLSGLVLIYWEDNDGNKTIIDFKRPGEILRTIIEIQRDKVGTIEALALNDSELKVFKREYMCSCSFTDTEIMDFYKSLISNDITSTYNQLKLHKETNLEKRYETFLNEYKDIYNDITDRMIANYLGVHYTTLSRLKSKILRVVTE